MKIEREIKMIVTRADHEGLQLSIKCPLDSTPLIYAAVKWPSESERDADKRPYPVPAFEGWALGDEVTVVLRNESQLEAARSRK